MSSKLPKDMRSSVIGLEVTLGGGGIYDIRLVK